MRPSSNIYRHRTVSKAVSPEFDTLLELNTFMSCVTSCAILLQDCNGYIDEQELDALLKDLCDKNKMVMSLLIDLFRLLFW